MFITWWSVYLISDLLSTLKFPASPSIANFRNDENWKPDRAWEMYHVRSLESPRVQITSSLKYLFLFMGTPEHGRGLQRLRSKLWPSWTCAWGVLPKVQLQGSTRRRLYVWFKGNPCCFRPIINIMKSLGMIKCCFFQHYFDGQKIILGCKQSLFLDQSMYLNPISLFRWPAVAGKWGNGILNLFFFGPMNCYSFLIKKAKVSVTQGCPVRGRSCKVMNKVQSQVVTKSIYLSSFVIEKALTTTCVIGALFLADSKYVRT